MKNIRGFASDNNSGVHHEILKAMESVNSGHTIAYGNDIYTASAKEKIKEFFSENIDIYFVFLGTAANVLGLKAITNSYNAIICAETAHINVDECGAPEKHTGCKLLSLPTKDGKLTIDLVKSYMHGFGFEHHSQPKIISITQATEMGTVYTPDEIKKITGFAHDNSMLVHMDGARICNAVAFSGVGFKEMTNDVGVDILSFGGTKNGMMYGESIIFFKKELSADFKYIRKQGMQLASKMRFMAVQFERLLTDGLWLKNAQHANRMAQLLAKEINEIPQIKITQKVQANGVFAIVPKKYIPILQKEYFFYMWNEETSEVRWMTSFDTTEEDILSFVSIIKKVISS